MAAHAAKRMKDNFTMISTTTESDASSVTSQHYMCFICYCHDNNRDEDRKWASWLHQQIEQYQVPADLVGKIGSRGIEIPKTIAPVFLDVRSLPADSRLSERIRNTLDQSDCLLILCSPRATQSTFVNDEIQWFLNAGRKDQIITVILDGKPNDPNRECFPEMLRHKIDSVAADFRLSDGSEGFTTEKAYRLRLNQEQKFRKSYINRLVEDYAESLYLNFLKVIAGIVGLSLDELKGCDATYQERWGPKLAKERWRISAMGATISALVVISSLVGALHADSKVLAASWLAPIVLIGLYVVWAMHFVPLASNDKEEFESMSVGGLLRALGGFRWVTADSRKKAFTSYPLKGLAVSPLFFALPIASWGVAQSESNVSMALWMLFGIAVTAFVPVVANELANFERLPIYPLIYSTMTSAIIMASGLGESLSPELANRVFFRFGACPRLFIVFAVFQIGWKGIHTNTYTYNVLQARQLFSLSLVLFSFWMALLLLLVVPFR